jgi:hypothetical protein
MLALSDTALAYIAIAATALPLNARGPCRRASTAAVGGPQWLKVGAPKPLARLVLGAPRSRWPDRTRLDPEASPEHVRELGRRDLVRA